MEFYKEIKVQPGSEEWLELRKQHITATDSAKIMGKNPWSSALDCYNEKIEGKTTFITPAMQRGMDLEPVVRDLLTTTYWVDLKPKVFESVEYPFMMASLDAISEDNKILYEIKVVGEKTMQKALKGDISQAYIIQCNKQMLVMGLDEMFLFYYYNEFLFHSIKIERDEKLIKAIIKSDTKFWKEHILPRVPPEKFSADEYEKIEDEQTNELAKNLIKISTKIKELKKEEDELKGTILDQVGEGNYIFQLADVKLKRIERKGNVNWKSVQENFNIKDEDLEIYRGKSINTVSFSEIK